MRPLAELIRPNIRTLAPYSTARDEYGGQRIDVWLDANESPYDNGVNRYPDPRQQRLREMLAARKGIAADRIFIGSGETSVPDELHWQPPPHRAELHDAAGTVPDHWSESSSFTGSLQIFSVFRAEPPRSSEYH